MPVFPSNVLITEALNLIKTETPYLALYTSNPTAADTGTEVTGGSYARQAITFGTITAGAMSNTGALTFSGLPAANITHWGIRDAASGGDLKVFGAMSSTTNVVSGDQVQFPISAITINLSGS